MSRTFWKTIIVIGWLSGFVVAFAYMDHAGHPMIEFLQVTIAIVFFYVIYMFATKQAPGDPKDDSKERR